MAVVVVLVSGEMAEGRGEGAAGPDAGAAVEIRIGEGIEEAAALGIGLVEEGAEIVERGQLETEKDFALVAGGVVSRG